MVIYHQVNASRLPRLIPTNPDPVLPVPQILAVLLVVFLAV